MGIREIQISTRDRDSKARDPWLGTDYVLVGLECIKEFYPIETNSGSPKGWVSAWEGERGGIAWKPVLKKSERTGGLNLGGEAKR